MNTDHEATHEAKPQKAKRQPPARKAPADGAPDETVIQFTKDELKDFVSSIVSNVTHEMAQLREVETVPAGEQTRVRTLDEASALKQVKGINWNDPKTFYMQVEKLPSAVDEELGDRILTLKDRGFTVEVETSRFVIVSLPREEYNRRIKENQDRSTVARKTRSAPPGLVADPLEKTEEEIDLHKLFSETMTDRMVNEVAKQQ